MNLAIASLAAQAMKHVPQKFISFFLSKDFVATIDRLHWQIFLEVNKQMASHFLSVEFFLSWTNEIWEIVKNNLNDKLKFLINVNLNQF